ncbi:MAG: selenide, water dikinase SelD [Chitinispirillaceae bacterium]|nr:selenide, water dikinase SelD [Chitinispirillaceae bacterium]
MGPESLAQVLRPLRNIFKQKDFPDLLVGLDVADDAVVYRVSDDLAIIHTVDFFTPVVDDPYTYGAIAAANAMSDVYAMGGEVKMALNICAFPPKLPLATISEILRGGAEKVAEAGGVLAGGHTIDDNEPKYGLAVIGEVHPGRFLTKAAAQPGDALLLTKPLGTGIITTAFKGDMADPSHLEAAIKSMTTLNRDAARLLRQVEVHACTDVTGFSLLGHGCEIAEKSNVRLRLRIDALPFIDGAEKYAREWLFPAGSCKNEACYKAHVRFDPEIAEETRMLLFTPETSGGLLFTVGSRDLQRLLSLFTQHQTPCRVIGEVLEGEGIDVVK